MPAANYPLVIEPGASFTLQMHYLQDDETTSALSAGWTARVQFRDAVGGNLLLDIVPAVNAPTGMILIQLTPSETEQCVGAKVWGCELHSANGSQVVRLVQGKVKISPEVVQ